jgi:hypothetical protein
VWFWSLIKKRNQGLIWKGKKRRKWVALQICNSNLAAAELCCVYLKVPLTPGGWCSGVTAAFDCWVTMRPCGRRLRHLVRGWRERLRFLADFLWLLVVELVRVSLLGSSSNSKLRPAAGDGDGDRCGGHSRCGGRQRRLQTELVALWGAAAAKAGQHRVDRDRLWRIWCKPPCTCALFG